MDINEIDWCKDTNIQLKYCTVNMVRSICSQKKKETKPKRSHNCGQVLDEIIVVTQFFLEYSYTLFLINILKWYNIAAPGITRCPTPPQKKTEQNELRNVGKNYWDGWEHVQYYPHQEMYHFWQIENSVCFIIYFNI